MHVVDVHLPIAAAGYGSITILGQAQTQYLRDNLLKQQVKHRDLKLTFPLCSFRQCTSVPVATVLRYNTLSVQQASRNIESYDTSIMSIGSCRTIVFSRVNDSNDHRQTERSWLPDTRTSPAAVTLTDVTGPL